MLTIRSSFQNVPFCVRLYRPLHSYDLFLAPSHFTEKKHYLPKFNILNVLDFNFFFVSFSESFQRFRRNPSF